MWVTVDNKGLIINSKAFQISTVLNEFNFFKILYFCVCS